jgi:hypothetical protein
MTQQSDERSGLSFTMYNVQYIYILHVILSYSLTFFRAGITADRNFWSAQLGWRQEALCTNEFHEGR